jgi:hypothetical protein
MPISTRIVCAALSAAAALSLIAAETLPVVPERLIHGFDTIRETSLRADLTFLASDALQGRLSLQPGDDAAIQWIAAEFAKAGLVPGNTDSYLQPVDLIEYRPDRSRSYVSLTRNGSVEQWQFPQASGVFPSDVDITAPVVFAGFGITAPELHYDDYQGIDVHGKIVLIFDMNRRNRMRLLFSTEPAIPAMPPRV